MPEIGEIARVVHYIKKHLVGKTLAKVTAEVDENVFGKVGCSAKAFEKALTGKRVLDAKQQGKYFWMVMSSPPHPLMHLGMAGWFKFNKEDTAYYKPKKSEEPEEWPPKYWKFVLETDEKPSSQGAFVDFRRFARIRLIDCAADEIRDVSPLVENGPDPVVDSNVLTEEWLTQKLQSKRIPVKALLLDQANISGIGNWVGDEILYDAKIHPEQYSNTLKPSQIAQLHKSIHYICKFSVDNLADSSKFPEEWLFKHRWGKGKKDSSTTLPNGSKFVFVTVGGRTSCVVPSVQKKTGPVAGDVKKEDAAIGEDEGRIVKPKKTKASSKRGIKAEDDETAQPSTRPARGKKRNSKLQNDNDPASAGIDGNEPNSDSEEKPAAKKQKSSRKDQPNGMEAKAKTTIERSAKANQEPDDTGRRRSKRVSGKGT